MRQANNNTDFNLFSGLDTTTINNLMSNGTSAGLGVENPFDAEYQILKALVALMIPVAWKDTTNGYQFIM
jgi:hypothetical protein